MAEDKLDKISEDIHQIQISIVRLTTHIESELGGPSTPGNITRQLEELSKSVKEINSTLQGENGYAARISYLEKNDNLIVERLNSIDRWKKELIETVNTEQLKEIKVEVEAQKRKWIIATTVFAIFQTGIALAIKFFK